MVKAKLRLGISMKETRHNHERHLIQIRTTTCDFCNYKVIISFKMGKYSPNYCPHSKNKAGEGRMGLQLWGNYAPQRFNLPSPAYFHRAPPYISLCSWSQAWCDNRWGKAFDTQTFLRFSRCWQQISLNILKSQYVNKSADIGNQISKAVTTTKILCTATKLSVRE